MKIGVNWPVATKNRRPLAEMRPVATEPLVECDLIGTLLGVDPVSLQEPCSTPPKQTSISEVRTGASGAGPRRLSGSLPFVSGAMPNRRAGIEPHRPWRVFFSHPYGRGTQSCSVKNHFSFWRLVPALPPAATRWANRRSAARLSARVPRRSPAAAWVKARPSALAQTWPFANSTQISVTDTFAFGLHRPNQSPTTPAQPLLSRGFSVFIRALPARPPRTGAKIKRTVHVQ